MPKSLDIVPRKCKVHGNPRWRVIVPVDIREEYNGDRCRFFADRESATSFCTDLRNARSNPHMGTFAVQPPRTLAVLATLLEQLDGDPKQIASALQLQLKHRNNEPEHAMKVSEVIDQFVASRATKSAKYQADLKSTGKKFAATFGERLIHTIRPREIENWWRNLPGISERSKVNYRITLRTLWEFAIIGGHAHENPIKKTAKPDAEDKHPCVLTPTQARDLLSAALRVDPEMAPWFAIGLFAGVRSEEINRLTTADINLEHKQIYIKNGKGERGKPRSRMVTILPVLENWLKLGFSFPVTNWRKRYDAVREAAGLVKILKPDELPHSANGTQAKWGTRTQRFEIQPTGWGKNCLRHSFASYAIRHFKDAGPIALEMGHSDPQTLRKHYEAVVHGDGGWITPVQSEEFFKLTPDVVAGLKLVVA